MDNFKKSANQLWKESNTTLTFKDWLEREKEKGQFIPNKKFISANGVDTNEIDKVLEEANAKAVDTLGLDSDKFETQIGIKNNIGISPDNNKFIGLNKWLLIGSLILIGGAVVYKIYYKKK